MMHLIGWHTCSNQLNDRQAGSEHSCTVQPKPIVWQSEAAILGLPPTPQTFPPSEHTFQMNHLALRHCNYANGSTEKSCLFFHFPDFLSCLLIFWVGCCCLWHWGGGRGQFLFIYIRRGLIWILYSVCDLGNLLKHFQTTNYLNRIRAHSQDGTTAGRTTVKPPVETMKPCTALYSHLFSSRGVCEREQQRAVEVRKVLRLESAGCFINRVNTQPRAVSVTCAQWWVWGAAVLEVCPGERHLWQRRAPAVTPLWPLCPTDSNQAGAITGH